MRRNLYRIVLMATAGIIALPNCAMAEVEQNTAPDPNLANAASDQTDIVVTANRREQSLRDVPLAIAAFSQESLDERSIRSMDDLAKITSGITFSPSGNGSSNIAIRGISSTVGAGTTGIYIDDTPLQARTLGASGSSTNAYPAIFDLERVEVLKGPQGTLFGAGSQGGAIRFITPQPGLSNYSAYGRAELAFTEHGDPSYEIGAAVGGPVVEDTLGFRVSAYHRRDGGWIDRVDRNSGAVIEGDSNSGTTLVLRGALKLAIGENFTITPSVNYQRISRHDDSQYWRHLSNSDEGDFNSGFALRQPWLDRSTLYSVAAEYDLGFASLISNTSYFDRDNPSITDYTEVVAYLLGQDWRLGFDNQAFSATELLNGQKIFTQEVRLQSQGSGPFKWVVGGFFQNAKQTAEQYVPEPNGEALFDAAFGASIEDILGIPLAQPGDLIYYGLDRSKDRQFAGFGQIDYAFTDEITATAGLRIAKTKFQSSNEQGGPFNGAVTSATAQQSERPITPKFGIDYKPNSDFLLYASVAKGYRVGGGNNPVPIQTCQGDLNALGLSSAPNSFNSDTVWSYEVGSKGSIANRLIRYEVSGFYTDWNNIQSAVPLSSCGFSFIANLGSAVSKGFDAHVTIAPTDGLTIDTSIGYTHAQFSEDVLGSPTSSGAARLLVASGDPLSVPPWSVSVAADYEATLSASENIDGYAHAEFNYNAGYDLRSERTFGYDPFENHRDAVKVVNLRLGMRKGNLDLSILANNLFNATPLTYVNRAPNQDLLIDQTIRPRTFGITATYRY